MTTEHDAFARTAAALSDTLRAHPALLAAAPVQFRNYLLDACGSDHRPLVELLLSVAGELRSRLSATDGASRVWESRRAPLVHHLVATRYLQPDVARWIVDSWGAALGVAPATIERPTLVLAGGAARSSSAEGASGDTGGGAFVRAVAMVPQAPASSRTAAPTPLPPPSWAGGKAGGFFRAAQGGTSPARPVARGKANAATPGMARPTTPRWRTAAPIMTAARLAQMQRMERISMALIVLAAIVVFIAAAIAITGRQEANVLAAAVLPVVTAGSPADSVLAAATGSMRPLPAVSPPAVIPSAPRDSAPGDSSGRATAMAPGFPGGGSVDAGMGMTRLPMTGAQAIARGLGGRYRVVQRAIAVTGSPSCSKVANALARGRTSIEVIAHAPGTFTFALASRSVTSTLDGDAYFEAGPMRGTTDGVSWNFRMRGRFTEHGFTAETQTATEAILRWGRTQSCMTVAELVAERLPE